MEIVRIWHAREDGVNGKEWEVAVAPPAGVVGAALEAIPADDTGTCPSPPFAQLCPRLDYHVWFETSGLYYVWLRGFAASAADEGAIVGLIPVNTIPLLILLSRSFSISRPV